MIIKIIFFLTSLLLIPSLIYAQKIQGEWKLYKINNHESGILPELTQHSTINFTDSFIDGNAICNTYKARYKIHGENIRFDFRSITEIACENMRLEDSIMHFLSNITSYKIKEDTLILRNDSALNLIFIKR